MKESKIGERITLTREGKDVEIQISGKVKPWQESLLFAWMLMWTLCGAIIIYYFFLEAMSQYKVFLLVYLAFWAYFEYVVVKTWMWRKWGKEVLRIFEGNLTIKNDVRGKGKAISYFVQNIKNLKVADHKPLSFMPVYFNSFWIRGGEVFSFDYMGKEVRFGRQLTNEDAKRLATVFKKELRKKG